MQVRRRHVLYIAGFDPRRPASTHRRYAEEGARQAAVSSYNLYVGSLDRMDAMRDAWTVRAEIDGAQTETRFECLRWDDIVRARWPRGAWGVLRATAFASWHLWRDGILGRTLRTSWPAFLALALPCLLLLATVLGGALLGMLALVAPVWAAVLALAGAGLAWRLVARAHLPWLMRSMAMLIRQGRGQTPDLEARVDAWAARLAAVLKDDAADEVLVVGHSSGAMLAMLTAARALRRQSGARLALLTLGHCTQMLSQQPAAREVRRELAELAGADGLTWVDVTAPPDACCMALVSPTSYAGPELANAPAPTLINPRFAQLFDSAPYAAVKRDRYRCHFQYLMAGQRPGSWDYFATTAGPRTLRARFPTEAGVTHFTRFQLLGGPLPW